MDIYSIGAQYYMNKYGVTQEHFAMVSAKNSYHASLNSNAQYQDVLSVKEVLAAREIVYPLTLPMCSPLGDGSAAVIVVSERKAREMALKNPVKVLSSALSSGWDRGIDDPGLTEECAQKAYNAAGIGPQDLSNVELHDASAPSELQYYESLGLCAKGESGMMIETGATKLGGRIPVNTSGGLLRKGHPVGATGAAQIVELTKQLQGRADKRQVAGARIALAHNAGGSLGLDAAACVVSILAQEDFK
jgi:acetyl-CoA acetyltransferase